MKHIKREEEMRRIVEASANRTTNIQRFCEEHNVSTAVFYYWRKRLQGTEVQNKFVAVDLGAGSKDRINDERSGIELCFGSVKVVFAERPDVDYLRSLLGLDD